MQQNIILNLIFSISLLFTLSSILARTTRLKSMFLKRRKSVGNTLFLIFLFSTVSILSTYTSIEVEGMLVNTRVIGILAGGLIGGPVVGIATGTAAALHRLFFSDGFTTAACATSAFVSGLICAAVYPLFQTGKWNKWGVFYLTLFTETIHMVLILIMSHPASMALQTVKILSLPMIFLNSLGILLFLSSLSGIFKERDIESARNLRTAFSMAKKCLPYVRKGLYSKRDMEEAVKIMIAEGIGENVVITDKLRPLAGNMPAEYNSPGQMPEIALKAMEKKQTETKIVQKYGNGYFVIASPLLQRKEVVGSLVVFLEQNWLTFQTDREYVEQLALLFSSQLELSEMELQKKRLRKAELKALRAQVNPHFLYNALNTISFVCRDDAGRARKLLLLLADYFRENLENSSYAVPLSREMKQVERYLELEKARFEEELEISIRVNADENRLVPSYILQPVVENAVKYGFDNDGLRKIYITANQMNKKLQITVEDRGQGFSEEALDKFRNGQGTEKHLGLYNVQQRLLNTESGHGSLTIDSNPGKTVVTLTIGEIPKDIIGGEV